jgi:hypothetical protein
VPQLLELQAVPARVQQPVASPEEPLLQQGEPLRALLPEVPSAAAVVPA